MLARQGGGGHLGYVAIEVGGFVRYLAVDLH